jgi:hypothetical protein
MNGKYEVEFEPPMSPFAPRVPYEFRGRTLPEELREKLARYAEERKLPGSFLQAVLENNLAQAVMRSDDDNLAALPAVVAYVYNEIPMMAWGSPGVVREWVTA